MSKSYQNARLRTSAAVSKTVAADQAGTTTSSQASLEGIDELSTAVADAEARIRDIYNSWSWRCTAPMRRLMEIYLHFRRKA